MELILRLPLTNVSRSIVYDSNLNAPLGRAIDAFLFALVPLHGLSLAILLPCPDHVVGATLSLEERAMKKIACTDDTIATRVRAVLARYGILQGIYQTGPSSRDPTIQLVLADRIDPADEPTIRNEVEAIGGAVIHN